MRYLLVGNAENFIPIEDAGGAKRGKTSHVIRWKLSTALLSNIVNGLITWFFS
jgi:hypothetical protein